MSRPDRIVICLSGFHVSARLGLSIWQDMAISFQLIHERYRQSLRAVPVHLARLRWRCHVKLCRMPHRALLARACAEGVARGRHLTVIAIDALPQKHLQQVGPNVSQAWRARKGSAPTNNATSAWQCNKRPAQKCENFFD